MSTAGPGDEVTFTIRAANTGRTPYTGTVISTALTGILDDATFDGQITATSGVPTYTAPNLSWTGTLDVGATVTITYTVTVRDPDPGDELMSTTVIASAQGSTCPSGSVNPACTTAVTVLVPALTIRRSASAATTTPGSVVAYTISITNTGQTPYGTVTVTDSLAGEMPDAEYNGDAAVTGGGVLAYTAPNLSWTGGLAVGASVSITYSVTVHDPDPGDKLLVDTVTSDAPGSSCPVGTMVPSCSTSVGVLVPGLVITKTADTASVVAGATVHYTVTVDNTGQTSYAPATFSDSLAGLLDDATYPGDAVASTGSIDYTNSTLVWTGALDVGATATITYSVTTSYPPSADHTLVNTALSTTPGANCVTDTDPRCSSTVVVLRPALTITKAADIDQVVAGGTVHYTISATNNGEADYPSATLTDSLAGVADDAVYNSDVTATSGAVTYSAGVLEWTGDLPVGATVVIDYSVTTDVRSTGDGILDNRVVSTSVGANCPADSQDSRCVASVPVAQQVISLTGLTPSFTLAGLPDSTVSSDGTLTMTVATNSSSGYVVAVQAASPSLTGTTPGDTDSTIPIDRLSVRETGTSEFQPLSASTPLVVHRQDEPSSPGGDAISNDFRVQIPFVPSDTYAGTLDYIVSAQ